MKPESGKDGDEAKPAKITIVIESEYGRVVITRTETDKGTRVKLKAG